ncbi:MAG: flagellar basal body P-ring formation protein FlgA [Thermotogae bacterium]|nr:flagellar basal body P-ring formation protein FlgA [Thermotogota bacterium]MCP5465460.1 flagellar basal body P-ring formation protein FlgA [Thermotogota bacterium]
MKKIFFTFFILYACILSYAGFNFTVPATVVNADNVLSLKDFFPEVNEDRILGYTYSENTVYEKEKIYKLLYGFLSIYYKNFELNIESETVTIIRNSEKTNYTFFDLDEFFRKWIKENYPEYSVVSVDTKNYNGNYKTLEIKTSYINRNKIFASIYAKNENDSYSYISISAEVADYRKIMIINSDIARNTVLNSSNTEEATLNVLNYNFNPVYIDNFKENKFVTTKNFYSGEPLNMLYIKVIPDVVSGNIIPIIVKIGNTTVKSFGRVMKDGNYGDIITVRNTSTGITVTGKLEEGPYLIIDSGGF